MWLGAAGRKLGTGPDPRPLEQQASPLQAEAPVPGRDEPLGPRRSAPTMAPRTLWSCYLCCLLTTAVGAASYPPRGYSLYTGNGGALSPGGPQAQSARRPASRHR